MYKASEIAAFLKSKLIGQDISVKGICSLDEQTNGMLSFAKKNFQEDLSKKSLLLVSTDKAINSKSTNSYIKVDNPRLAYAKVCAQFFSKKKKASIAKSTFISKTAQIGKNVSIGENCVIGDAVTIGKNTVINHNVVITNGCKIGNDCYILSNATIGEEGFGFDFENKVPVRLPHLGSVVIGNNVEVGSNSFIARGTIKNTIIEDNVKIDAQAHISHNCKIGKNSLIIAHAELNGGVIIGENCWIGPNSAIFEKVKIGNNVTIGMGAIVNRPVSDNKKIMGLEAVDIWSLIKYKKSTKYPHDA